VTLARLLRTRETVTRETDANWRGARGRLDRAALSELVHDPATLCFVCGPPALVEEMKALLADLGIPARRIRVEEWG
jgi:ferredoxin-NADP reductase